MPLLRSYRCGALACDAVRSSHRVQCEQRTKIDIPLWRWKKSALLVPSHSLPNLPHGGGDPPAYYTLCTVADHTNPPNSRPICSRAYGELRRRDLATASPRRSPRTQGGIVAECARASPRRCRPKPEQCGTLCQSRYRVDLRLSSPFRFLLLRTRPIRPVH